MPRSPFYSGPISNRVASAYGPSYSVGDVIASGVTDAVAGKGGLISRLFGPDPNDPDAAQAAYYRAKTDEVQASIDDAKDKTRRRQEGDASVSNFADAGLDLSNGGSRAAMGGLTSEGATPQEPPAGALMKAVYDEYISAAGRGDKDSQERLSPILQALATRTGDPNAIITMNSGMGFKGNYIKGENGVEAATAGQQQSQVQKVMDQEMGIARMGDATDRYKVGVESGDRRFNTTTDASVQMRGQNLSSANTRRGQDMTDSRARKDKAIDMGTETVQTVTVDKGQAPKKPGLLGRIMGEQAVEGRAPSKTTKTVKRPIGAAKQKFVYDPKSGGLIEKR